MPKKHREHQIAVSAQHLSYSINGNDVLSDLSFNIQAGDYVGILGPNGSGKTTMLRILLGLLQPDDGTVSLFGHSPGSFPHFKWIGYVPQRASRTEWDFPATVQEIVKSGRTAGQAMFHRYTTADRRAVQRAMKAVDITDLAQKNIGDLSGGQRQRVFIARALASEPKVLILDEPTTGVDITVQHEFYAFLKKLNKEQGMTILLVSHDIDAITHETDTVLCINHTLVCHMPTHEFLDSAHMKELFGHHATHVYHDHGTQQAHEHADHSHENV